MVTDELAPGFGVSRLEGLLSAYRDVAELVIVGHEPDLSGVAAALLASPTGISLKKGAAIKLKIDPTAPGAPAEFKWLAAGKNLANALEES